MRADLVLEGGGVRGIGLVGAVTGLAGRGYAFERVAGSSAGAVVAALVAALQHAGEPLSRLEEIARSIDYRSFRDSTLVGRVPLVRRFSELLTTDGLYRGDQLEKTVAGLLADLGVRTFGDLRRDDPGGSPADGWQLVTTASDLSGRRLLRLPWDAHLLGLDPDGLSVAKAVRASSAIPFFFEPVQLGQSTCVDGGLLSDFPVALFDRGDGAPPRWPTIGVRLRAAPDAPVRWGARTKPVHGPLGIAVAAVETLFSAQDASYTDLPHVLDRTVFVDASDVNPVDFDIGTAQRQALFDRGLAAARAWQPPTG